MNRARINKALLFVIQEAGGELSPGQLDKWLGDLKKAGYIDYEPREVIQPDDRKRPTKYNLPHIVITEEGRAAL